MQYIELMPDGETFDRIAKVLDVDEELLIDVMDELKLFENLFGYHDGKTFTARNGVKFSFNQKTKRIDGSVIIKSIEVENRTRAAQISGFPLTIKQRKQLEESLK